MEAHADRYGLDPDEVYYRVPLARMHVWLGASRERRGEHRHQPTPAELDLLDELNEAGSVEAWLKRGETPAEERRS